MRLWEHRDRVAPEAARTWLLRTTHRLCVDRVRRLARLSRQGQSLSRRERRTDEPGDGERIAIRGDERDALARAVGTLPFRDRAVILLREVQGLSYAELSEVLELPIGSVKACLHRARRRLRDAMRNEDEPGRSSPTLEKETSA